MPGLLLVMRSISSQAASHATDESLQNDSISGTVLTFFFCFRASGMGL